MNTSAELDRIVRAWLRDRAVEPSRTSLTVAVERVLETPQHRRRWLGWWFGRGGGATRGAGGHGPRNVEGQGRNRHMSSITVATGLVALLLVTGIVAPRGDPATSDIPAVETGAILTVAVDGSGDYTTISDAIAAADDGDTVLVHPGRYDEVLVIDKDITVQGDGPREHVVVAIPEGTARVDLGDFTADLAIQFRGSDGIVRGLSTGPVLMDGGAPALQDVVVTPRDGLAVAIGAGSAPLIRDSSVTGSIGTDGLGVSPTLEGNTLSGGIVSIDGPGQATIKHNTFRGSEGISASNGLTGLIEGNEFVGARLGVDTGSNLVVRGNSFRDVPGLDGRAAIEIRDGETVARVVDNELVDNKIGISWANSEGTIEGNTIRGGMSGIFVLSGAPSVVRNSVEGASYRGIAVSDWASPLVTSNSICGCGENLHLDENAAAVVIRNTDCDGAADGADGG